MAADDVELVKARGRLADAKRWLFDYRGWDVLPHNERGRLILTWAADHAWVAGAKNPRRSVRNWCRKYASPWLSDSELDEVVSQAEARNTPHPQRWSHDQSAVTLEYSISDRKELPLRFIGADDDPDYQWRNQHKLSVNAASARKYRAKHRSGRPCGRPRLDLSESEKVSRKRKQSAESSARHRAANSSGAKRGRPRAAVPAWKAAGFKSKRSYQRHKANGTENASAKTPSCDIKNIDRMTEFSVTEFRCQSAERLKRAGAEHGLTVVESDTLAPVAGGSASSAASDDRSDFPSMDGDVMAQPASDGNGDELDLDAPLTFEDYVAIVCDDIDEAAHNLEEHEIEPLCTAIRAKIGDVLREVRRRQQLDRPAAPEPEERDPHGRWWDR